MESWRMAFRVGLLPQLSRGQLEALADGLRRDDPRIVQGATTVPVPLMCVQDWPCEAACPVAFCGLAVGLVTVGEAEEFFSATCFEMDRLLGEPAGCRWLMNFVDETPRAEMRRELLAEIEAALARPGA